MLGVALSLPDSGSLETECSKWARPFPSYGNSPKLRTQGQLLGQKRPGRGSRVAPSQHLGKREQEPCMCYGHQGTAGEGWLPTWRTAEATPPPGGQEHLICSPGDSRNLQIQARTWAKEALFIPETVQLPSPRERAWSGQARVINKIISPHVVTSAGKNTEYQWIRKTGVCYFTSAALTGSQNRGRQKFILSQFWRPEIKNQGVGKADSFWGWERRPVSHLILAPGDLLTISAFLGLWHRHPIRAFLCTWLSPCVFALHLPSLQVYGCI